MVSGAKQWYKDSRSNELTVVMQQTNYHLKGIEKMAGDMY